VSTEIEPFRCRAIDYAWLVGRFVKMARPATPEELAATGESEVGMEGMIVRVADTEAGVDISSDWHFTWTIAPDTASQWRFTIWPDENHRVRDTRIESVDAV
jgi:hypothetical protein